MATRVKRPAPAPEKLEDLPNIGPATAADLRLLGILTPAALRGRDPRRMYERLCEKTGTGQDPCVLDVFMAIVDHANGAPARPWWTYTETRKRALAAKRPARRSRP